MTSFAPTIEAFFLDRLLTQRNASPRTIAAYRDTLRLLLTFAQDRLGKPASNLDVADIDAKLVGEFLTYLERDRHNAIRTRNVRLAAIRALFRYAALQHPEHAGSIQRVLAIPTKRYERTDVAFLQSAEVDALLAAPDRTTWTGRRDHALLVLAIQTGVRVSELTGLTHADLTLATTGQVRCHGKGRKERVTPLSAKTVTVLRVWLREQSGTPTDSLFPTSRGGRLSSDAVQWLLAKHANNARQTCPSLINKKLSPHVLRHTCAMQLLQAGVDSAVIALWLGHESSQTTQIYLHADMAMKEKALARTAPPGTHPGRYRPPDALLNFLDKL